MAHLLHLRVDESPSQGGVVHRGVAGDARDLLRETGQEQRHPGDVAVVFAGLVRAPEVDILDLRGRHAAPLREGFEDCRAEVVWTDGAQSAAVAADRGAYRGHDPSFVGSTVAHTSLLILTLGFLAPRPESPLRTIRPLDRSCWLPVYVAPSCRFRHFCRYLDICPMQRYFSDIP